MDKDQDRKRTTWVNTANGLAAPTTVRTASIPSSFIPAADAARRAEQVRTLFAKNGQEIEAGSDLDVMLRATTKLSGEPVTEWSEEDGIRATYFSRIAKSLLLLEEGGVPDYYFAAFARQSIDPLARVDSHAKNYLLEMELCQHLKTHLGLDAKLGEPDNIVILAGVTVPVACKNLYSQRNVGRGPCRRAKGQLRGRPGIVALGLEQLFPSKILSGEPSQIFETLYRRNEKFWQTHAVEIGRTFGDTILALILFNSAIAKPFGAPGVFEPYAKHVFVTHPNPPPALIPLIAALSVGRFPVVLAAH